MSKSDVFESVDQMREELMALAEDLWDTPERGLREDQSAELLQELLAKEGFDIETGIGDLPTAFIATFGKKGPKIGVLGEYDALPGLSQKPVNERDPVTEGAPGHGCGHNLLGAGCVGAAIAIKRAIEDGSVDGQIRFYGCPAEEQLIGKVYMAREGAFDDLDAALTWHPKDTTRVQRDSSLALDSIKFTFFGTAAHASAAPDSGRSALDAVQLMNTGVEYMREHVPTESQIHYTISDGGDAPNVVPAKASVWYFVRGPDRETVTHVTDWLSDVGKGAARMTQTNFESRVLTGCYSLLPNSALSDILWENADALGSIPFDEGDYEKAAQLQETVSDRDIQATIEQLPESQREEATDRSLFATPVENYSGGTLQGSSDVGDVSWIVPTAWFYATTYPVGTPAHSWQAVSSAGSFGTKTVPYVAKVLAGSVYDLLTNQEIIRRSWNEFRNATSEQPYRSPLPDDVSPPFDHYDAN